VLGVALADYASHALSLDDFAVLTDRLYAAANFHGSPRCFRTDGVSRTTGASSRPDSPCCSSLVKHRERHQGFPMQLSDSAHERSECGQRIGR
jgi:hypothetical protein